MKKSRGRKVYKSIVFLKEGQEEEHFKNLAAKEGMFIIGWKEASEKIKRVHGVKCLPAGERCIMYVWRLATRKEWNTAVQKQITNRAFNII
jgi:hypothetical protein